MNQNNLKLLLFHLIFIWFINCVQSHNNYVVVLEKFVVEYINPAYGSVVAAVSKYNRTNYVLNANFTFAKDITEENDVAIKLQAFSHFSNEYRPVPVVLQTTWCQTFKSKFWKVVEKEIMKDSYFPNKCPIKKGENFRIINFSPDGSKMPANVPWEKVMLAFNYTDKNTNELYLVVKIYAWFDHNAKYKKN